MQVMSDEGVPRGLDVTGLVQRIAVTLASPETYRKARQLSRIAPMDLGRLSRRPKALVKVATRLMDGI